MTITRERLQDLVSNFSKTKIAVLGDLYLDRYGTGVMEGIAREAPIPILRLRGENCDIYSPGGGANVCANVADLGPKTYPISVFGDDSNGFELTNQLKARNMDTRYIVTDESRVTPTFEKFFASAHGSPIQQVGRVDIENSNPISKDSEDRIIESLEDARNSVNAIVVADYADTPGTWVVTERVLEEIAKIGEETDIPIISDSRTRIEIFKNTIAVPNEYEASVATGLYEDTMAGIPPDPVVDKAGQLLSARLRRPAFVTRGPKSISIYEGEKIQHIPSIQIKGEIDTCGAGDTVDAGIAAALASGATLGEAAEIGDIAAKITIKKIGTTGTATPDEMMEFFDRHLIDR